jgi:emp24/gp25L/p24 family/GOLD
LLGKDADDAFTRSRGPNGDSKNVSEFVDSMLVRTSRVHKELDEVSALQQFADVRFARSFYAAGLTGGRVQWWTLLESSVVVLVALLQAYIITSFELRGPLGVFLGSKAAGFSSGAAAGKLQQSRGFGNGPSGAGGGSFHAV